MNLVELWNQMGWPVRSVVLVLTLQALFSLTVALDRLLFMRRVTRDSREVARRILSRIEEGALAELLDEARAMPGLLASLLASGIGTFVRRRDAGDDAIRAAELSRRALERRGETVGTVVHRGMGVLASTGSTAPFVGLLGTVLGIIQAFQMIAANGSGGIGTIGASIGEALVVTGYGLCVAIPTVLGFNFLSARLTDIEHGLARAAAELADNLETLGDDARRGERLERTSGRMALAS